MDFTDWKPGDPDSLRVGEIIALQNREIRALAQQPVIGAIAARLAGADTIRLWESEVISKAPAKTSPTAKVGWHTDRAYWMTCTSTEMLTAWIPFHDCPIEMGPLMVADGSHMWAGIEQLREFQNSDLSGVEDKIMEGQESIEKVSMALAKGQMSFHNALTLHASDVNRSDMHRTSLALHLQDGATDTGPSRTSAVRPGRSSTIGCAGRGLTAIPTMPTRTSALSSGPRIEARARRTAQLVSQLRIIDLTEPEWDRWIESTAHDVYHTSAYHRVVTFDGDGTAQLIVYGTPERFVAWPYLLNSIPNTRHGVGGPAFDVTSTYGYCGPLAHGCAPDDPIIRDAWRTFQAVWHEQHVVSVFTRFHPILQNHAWFVDSLTRNKSGGEAEGVVRTGETVSIDLRRPDAQIISEYPRTFRQEIASNWNKGLTTEIDSGWSHLEVFLELYAETMRRNRAQDAYFLRRQYFVDLIDELGDDAILVVTKKGEDIAAACLFLSHHGILHPHLAGTSTPFLPMSPLKVMWDDVRRWAAERGDWVMHLGGGRGGAEDSLFSFKSRFSPVRAPFYTGRWILDERRYELLARRAGADTDQVAGYFPIYRAPRTLE